MVKGKPDAGILPSGQVAGLIEDLPSVSDLIESIVEEAQQSADRISQMIVPQENNQ
jgi:NAD(P)H-dependent flavin oxidoreductase YrpB (nitropropane dioxygenase family)